MSYIESVCVAGKTIEIERYYSSRYGKRNQSRSERVEPTKEEQKRINTKMAEKKLRRLMNANFEGGDYHLVLTYRKARGEPPREKAQMKEDIAKFLRTLRKYYKSEGKELKYIHVMEIGSKGARHHHLVINKIDTSIIQKCWPHGRININPLDDTGQYSKLAAYFIKYSSRTIGTEEELQGKRWASSRNLIHPQPAKKIISERSWYRSEAKVPAKYAGKYYVDQDSVELGINNPEYCGYGYFRFTLVQLC